MTLENKMINRISWGLHWFLMGLILYLPDIIAGERMSMFEFDFSAYLILVGALILITLYPAMDKASRIIVMLLILVTGLKIAESFGTATPLDNIPILEHKKQCQLVLMVVLGCRINYVFQLSLVSNWTYTISFYLTMLGAYYFGPEILRIENEIEYNSPTTKLTMTIFVVSYFGFYISFLVSIIRTNSKLKNIFKIENSEGGKK